MFKFSVVLVFVVLGVLTASGNARAQNYTIELDILNPQNEAGDVVLLSGDDIEVEYIVVDPDRELSKNDVIELYVVETGLVIDRRKRGVVERGIVSLKTVSQNRLGAYVQVRYVSTDGDTLATAPDGPALVLPDESTAVLLDRIVSLEQQVAELEAQIDAHEEVFYQHTVEPAAHHQRYTDNECLDAIAANGVEWDLLKSIPPDIADGDQDTTLTEYDVGAIVADLGFITEVEWEDIAGVPADLSAIDSFVSVSGSDIYFDGANVYIRNGTGGEDDDINGLGNLIVGYNESTSQGHDRSGSHNLVVGDYHSYSSRYGVVFGHQNTVSMPWATVTGGRENVASGIMCSVTGGQGNTASGIGAVVAGGANNSATGFSSPFVGGGWGNTASNWFASVLGGYSNTASGEYSTVGGGAFNEATGIYEWVAQ